MRKKQQQIVKQKHCRQIANYSKRRNEEKRALCASWLRPIVMVCKTNNLKTNIVPIRRAEIVRAGGVGKKGNQDVGRTASHIMLYNCVLIIFTKKKRSTSNGSLVRRKYEI